MRNRDRLRETRAKSVINVTSKQQEQDIIQALEKVVVTLQDKHSLHLHHDKMLFHKDIVAKLQQHYHDESFSCSSTKSHIIPDGGILSVTDNANIKYPILIAETKFQGTNDVRAEEGLSKQAIGNAVERLGKNVICLRLSLCDEDIFPFVCFGYGCDFANNSTLLDRVRAIGLYGNLNTIYLENTGDGGRFNRGSFYFRENKWTVGEMEAVLYDIAERSIYYYFSKYGKEHFVQLPPA